MVKAIFSQYNSNPSNTIPHLFIKKFLAVINLPGYLPNLCNTKDNNDNTVILPHHLPKLCVTENTENTSLSSTCLGIYPTCVIAATLGEPQNLWVVNRDARRNPRNQLTDLIFSFTHLVSTRFNIYCSCLKMKLVITKYVFE